MFPTQKSKFGYILEGLAMEDVGIFDRHLVYFTGDLVYFVLIWYIFPHFGMLFQKNLATPRSSVASKK
jgi:hypothetical protein